MSDDKCPVLTDNDIQLIGSYKEDIAEIQSYGLPDEYLPECGINDKKETKIGGNRKNFTEILVKMIVFIITASAAGASTALFLTVIPENWQMYIISIANRSISLPVCRSTTDYALGMAQSFLNPSMSCSYRAQMLEQGITRIQTAVGVITGISTATLQDKVRDFITGNSRQSIQDSSYSYIPTPNSYTTGRGGKRKSKKTRKARKARKSKKSRKSRRY
jgi:hypothetical protein